MLVKIMKTTAITLLVAAAAAAQSVYTPAKGSPERKAILDALRIPVERELKQKITFNARYFNVSGRWAFVGGDPLAIGGGRPDYRGTEYQQAIDADMFDNNFFAILQKTGTKWKVVHYDIGCTDVCYASWWRRFKAPKRIFPYTE